MPQHDQRQTTTSTTTQTNGQSGNSRGGGDAQTLVGNGAIVDIIREQNKPTGQRKLDPNKNGIVYFGLNAHASDEAKYLNRANADRGGAVAATPGKDQDQITLGGKKLDLTTEAGAAQFVASLGLPNQMAVDVATWLFNGPASARDELAQFIKILAQAEMGERKIDRMVLSGHSVGSMIWGDDNGMVQFSEFESLFELFPKAGAQVQHLMLSACYSGGESKMGQYHGMLPELDSIWAYHDSSPGTWSGAMDHMGAWEKATEPGKDAGGVDPSLAAGKRKAANVSTWNQKDGYQGDQPMDFWELQRQLDAQRAVFDSHFRGDVEVTDTQAGPLRQYYNLVQRCLSHRDATGATAAELGERRDTTIRLIFFKLVSGKFQSAYQAQLQAGYKGANQTLPDFTKLGRKGTLDAIAKLEAAGGDSATAKALDLLKGGLRDLRTDLIPTSWV
jgi:hypothetical protein